MFFFKMFGKVYQKNISAEMFIQTEAAPEGHSKQLKESGENKTFSSAL